MVNELDYMKESVYDLSFIYRDNREIVNVLDIVIENVKEIIVLPTTEYIKKDIKTLVDNKKCNLIEIVDNYKSNELKAVLRNPRNIDCPVMIKRELMKKELPVILLVQDVDYEVFLKKYYYVSLDKLNIFLSESNDSLVDFVDNYILSKETIGLVEQFEELNKKRYEEYYIDLMLSENKIEELKNYMNNN